MAEFNRITKSNVYLDGNKLLGKVDEIDLPDISSKMEEVKSLGMVGSIELPDGFEKMEGSIKWTAFYADAFAKIANPFQFVKLQVRANVETFDSAGLKSNKPLVTFLTVAFKKLPGGKFAPQKNAEYPAAFACHYIKQVFDGQEIVEFDPVNNIYRVNGVDLLADVRANIG